MDIDIRCEECGKWSGEVVCRSCYDKVCQELDDASGRISELEEQVIDLEDTK